MDPQVCELLSDILQVWVLRVQGLFQKISTSTLGTSRLSGLTVSSYMFGLSKNSPKSPKAITAYISLNEVDGFMQPILSREAHLVQFAQLC